MRRWLVTALLVLLVAEVHAAPRKKKRRRASRPVPHQVDRVETSAARWVDVFDEAQPQKPAAADNPAPAPAPAPAPDAPPAAAGDGPRPGATGRDPEAVEGEAAVTARAPPVESAGAAEADAVVAESPPAAGPPAAFTGSSNTLSQWHGDNRDDRLDNDGYGALLVRHNLLLDGGAARAAVRVDQELFARNRLITEEGQAPYRVDRRNDSRLERVSLEAEGSWKAVTLRATAGDFYAQLGRGLVLVLRKYDELGVDVSARGAKAEAAFLRESLTFTALGGVTNIVNVNPDVHSYLPDPSDKVGGAKVEGRIADLLTLSAQGATVHTGTPLPDLVAQDRAYNYGGSVQLELASWTAAAEIARQLRRQADAIDHGSALYATATGPLGPLTVLAELKHYQLFEPLRSYHPLSRELIQYSLPPSTEKIDQEVLDNSDVTGGRLRIDWTLGKSASTIVHANYGRYLNRQFGQTFTHVFGGVRRRSDAGAGVFLVGGLRREVDNATGLLSRQFVQGEVDLILPLTATLGLHATAHGERITKMEGPSMRGNSLLELDWRSKLAIGAGYEWDTTTPGSPTHYGFGALSFRPNDRFVAQALVGTQRGGLKCFAGICRVVPPFAGARLEMTLRY